MKNPTTTDGASMQTTQTPQKRYPTDEAIDLIAQIRMGSSPDVEQQLFRHALEGLVRLAKMEQLVEMQRGLSRCTGMKS